MMMAPLAPHVPVLIGPILRAVAPVAGIWIDGTLGAGGYARALLDAGAERVIGIDRDPEALGRAAPWAGTFGERLLLRAGRFGELDRLAAEAGFAAVDGVVLDIGVSSMQLDQAARGFSFQKDGPLDMRMSQSGPTAADLVNALPEAELADILYQLGEERAARRIARAIAADRRATPFTTTGQLAGLIERLLPRPRPGQPHAATRSFQALRIAVNDELGELARGLAAAEAVLRPGGWLAVVTFHSLEDRVVKRFLQLRSGAAPRGSRHAPEIAAEAPRFDARHPQGGGARRGRGRGEPARPFGKAPDRPPPRCPRRPARRRRARPAADGAAGARMRIVLHLSAAILVVICATWAYRVNYATQEAMNRVADLRRAIAAEREAIAVLNAEWAYLNRPDRLRELALQNAEALGLAELTPDQFGEAATVAFPPEPADLVTTAGATP